MEHVGEGKVFEDPRAEGRRANLINIFSNGALSVMKLGVGFTFHTQSLIADGIHSATDVLHTVIAWIGFRIAEKPPDEDHPYGHGNAEAFAGLIIGVILHVTGLFVAWHGFTALMDGTYETQGWLALSVALFAVFFKEILARYNLKVGGKLNSPVLIAIAADHRSDALASFGAVIGITGAMLGYPYLDPIGGIFIGFWIVFISFPILRQNVDILMDAAPRGDLEKRIAEQFQGDEEVRIDSVRIHPLGAYFEVDLEIAVDGDLSVRQGHEIAHRVRDQILAAESHVNEVKVHVNPPEGDTHVNPTKKRDPLG